MVSGKEHTKDQMNAKAYMCCFVCAVFWRGDTNNADAEW